ELGDLDGGILKQDVVQESTEYRCGFTITDRDKRAGSRTDARIRLSRAPGLRLSGLSSIALATAALTEYGRSVPGGVLVCSAGVSPAAVSRDGRTTTWKSGHRVCQGIPSSS